ncbi:hypothetical protein JB92DRAFT_3108151 [Gautieria morchelliformis]|nr:hypothetical protein JB92DRAFT_3108151 [Gautieria morchelliformis]
MGIKSALPSINASLGDGATADADEEVDEEDLDVDVDPTPNTRKAKPSKQGEMVDVKFWRGVEADYIEKLIHEDNSQFGKKQSAAHALLLVCHPSPPPTPIGSDVQLPEGSAAMGVLENEYGASEYYSSSYTDSYEQVGSVAAAPRGYREFQS